MKLSLGTFPEILSIGNMKRWKLTYKRECRTLTLFGWFITLLVIAVSVFVAIAHMHSFLAVTNPIAAEILVVEGWLPDYALKRAIDEFNAQNYQLLITTGEPITLGYYLFPYKSFAEIAASTLKEMGFPECKLAVVPGPPVLKDRTYASATALQKWLSGNNLKYHSINIFSFGAHARRSRLLFQKALGKQYQIGIIAAENLSYDPTKWWLSSDGVRTVIDEMIAYCYAKLLFHP